MPVFVQYMMKFSLSLALLYIFYQLILRRLTFYNWNRWCLVGYSLLALLVPFINITSLIEESEAGTVMFIYRFPAVDQLSQISASGKEQVNWWGFVLSLLLIGMGIMLFRLVFSLFSFYRMLKNAEPISNNGVAVYQVNRQVIPFSFGNAIFINPKMHTDEELKEIIRHEFVHVRQGHTMDIIWAEIICIINWYNPFAWLLRKAIRQNLEFIADHKVLEKGVDKKEYQYLLLKVIGNNQFSIASQFNFSSLKKRIAMMNKMKSARVHLAKFLFLLPLLAVMLLASRSSVGNNFYKKHLLESFRQKMAPHGDSLIPVNSKGYYLSVGDNKGKCTVLVRDEKGNQVKRIDLLTWKADPSFAGKYGEIPPPHAPEDCPLKEDCEVVIEPEVAAVNEAYGATEAILPNVPRESRLLFTGYSNTMITGEEDIIITITKNTTPQELEGFIREMKAKGVELKFSNRSFNDGILTQISGTLAANGSNGSFSASDFKTVKLAVTTKGGKTYFKVLVNDPNQC